MFYLWQFLLLPIISFYFQIKLDNSFPNPWKQTLCHFSAYVTPASSSYLFLLVFSKRKNKSWKRKRPAPLTNSTIASRKTDKAQLYAQQYQITSHNKLLHNTLNFILFFSDRNNHSTWLVLRNRYLAWCTLLHRAGQSRLQLDYPSSSTHQPAVSQTECTHHSGRAAYPVQAGTHHNQPEMVSAEPVPGANSWGRNGSFKREVG